MRIGLDFDNTLVCYDGLFRRLATERGLLPEGVRGDKTSIRDHLRRIGRESEWTAMQGEAYGMRIGEAEVFGGAEVFISTARQAGHELFIVSHKTLRPFAGPSCDLHEAARGWLEGKGLAGDAGILGGAAVFLELTREDKLGRIAALACDVFVDDLPEFLTSENFPAGVRRVLFDPAGANRECPLERVESWDQLRTLLL